MLRERRRHANFKPNRRLDRKSSRGMIYENEELRLRTININAEVERGQSNIRKLRRENEQLRREIWSLRDEYDRLNKLLKIHERNDCCDNDDESGSNSEKCDSCETCKEDEYEANNLHDDECFLRNKNNSKSKSDENFEQDKNLKNNEENSKTMLDSHRLNPINKKSNEELHVNFDHLSVVSEENLTTTDSICGLRAEMDSSILKNQQTPTTDLREYTIPPLSYFENIVYENVGQNLCDLDDPHYGTSAAKTHDTVKVNKKNWDLTLKPISDDKNEKEGLMLKHLDTNKNPKNFFSQIKPHLKLNSLQKSISLNTGPDFLVSNVLASNNNKNINNTFNQTDISPSKLLLNEKSAKLSLPACNNNSFQKGGNLDDLLLDIETLSNDIMQMQLDRQKSYSQERIAEKEIDDLIESKKNFRSEMNLVLSFNGNNTIIASKSKTASISSINDIENDQQYSKDMPKPMILFPQNLACIGFEKLNQLENFETDLKTSTASNLNNSENIAQIIDELPVLNPITESPKLPKKCSIIRRKFFVNRSNDNPQKFDSKDKDDSKSLSGSDTSKRKTRRLSLIFGAKKSQESDLNKNSEKENEPDINDMKKDITKISDDNDINQDKKNSRLNNTSVHSTPNSPHFTLRRNNSNQHHNFNHSHNHSHHHHHSHYNQRHGRKMSQTNTNRTSRTNSQIKRYSRRHSDGTVISGITNFGLGSNTIFGNNPITNFDNFNEHILSITSEPHANSLASSRDSSSSLSMRSQRRKLSINSHSGGKIPWCGCWGNGCF